MKKHALAVALTGALGAIAVNAATVSEFANGVLVPYVRHGGDSSDTTVVGLTSCAAGTVFWTFFDPDTKHITDAQFNMTADDMYGFDWSAESGADLTDTEGYLVFVFDNRGGGENLAQPNGALDTSDDPCLAGAAFQLDLANSDVAYVPALPLDTRPDYVIDDDDTDADDATDPFTTQWGDFGAPNFPGGQDPLGIFIPDLTDMDENDVVGLNAGANAGDEMYMRYFIDNEDDSGIETRIYIWSAQDLRGRYTVNIYNDDQARRSVNFELDRAELNIINPEEIIGRPNDFVDGFVRWRLPITRGDEEASPPNDPMDGDDGFFAPSGDNVADPVRGVFAWSVISSPTIGAVQTIPALIRLLDNSGEPVFRARVVEDDGNSIRDHRLEP